MILSAQSIRKECEKHFDRPLIEPFHERTVSEGYTFGLSPAGYDIRVAETLILCPGDRVLASTMEKFNIRPNLLASIHDKSTWARQFLFVQNTIAEPGWSGYLTLEISYDATPSPSGVFGKDKNLRIEAGTSIAQVIFHVLDEPTVQPYAGRYQDQEAGPQIPRFAKTEDKVF